jgi:hypothetical protein
MGGNAVLTFWIGYILTRPFGAALGDLLTQAKTYGGLGMGAMWTSALFLSVIVMLVAVAQIGMNAGRSAQAAGNPLPNSKEKSCPISTLSLALSPPCRRWRSWPWPPAAPSLPTKAREHRLCTVCQCQHGIAGKAAPSWAT